MLRIDESWYVKPEGAPERTSAGGIVARVRDGRVYIALTREKGLSGYVIPKGGVEPGESLVEAAHREIREEAGLSRLKLLEKLGVRERWDVHKKRWIVAHYFLFVTDEDFQEPTDRANHYDPGWFPLDELPALFWPEQRELIEAHRERIQALLEDDHAQALHR